MSTYNEERGYVAPPRPIGRTMQGSEPLFIVSVIEQGEERFTCIATLAQAEDLEVAAGHYDGLEVVCRRPNAVGTALQWMNGLTPRVEEEE